MTITIENTTVTIAGTNHNFDSKEEARNFLSKISTAISDDSLIIDIDAQKAEAEAVKAYEESMNEYRICPETGTKITKSMVAGCYSDTYKSIHGIRPRWIAYHEYSMEELGDMLTSLQNEAEEHYREEVKWEREQRKIRRRSEKRYQKIRKDAKSVPPQATYSLGEVLQGVL